MNRFFETGLFSRFDLVDFDFSRFDLDDLLEKDCLDDFDSLFRRIPNREYNKGGLSVESIPVNI